MSGATHSLLIESGEPWLGPIPSHWRLVDLKFLSQFINGCAFRPEDWQEEGVPIIRIANLNGGEEFNFTQREVEPRYRVNKGDLLFGWSGNKGTSFGPFLWDRHGTYYLNQHIFRLTGYSLNKSYFLWLLKAVTVHVENQTSGIIGLVHITKEDLGNIRVPIAPPDEQLVIADFLDRKTAQIDALIARKQRQIELLGEKRQALISQAVTKGLDPTVPMQDSGLDWLGLVPAHWEPRKLKHLFRRVKRQGHPEKTVLSVYRDYGVIEKTSRDDNYNRTPEDLTVYQLVEPNNLVVNKMKAWQGSLGISSFEGITSPDYVVFEHCHKENSRYLHHLLRIPRLADVYRSISNGIRPAQWRLEPEDFLKLMVCLPPLDEQAAIVHQIDKILDRDTKLSAVLEKQVQLLADYRQTLISAAVTGKLDVLEGE